jgi:RimJ/RimL family protein N-acetyltransferase
MVRALIACLKSHPDLNLKFRYLPVFSDRDLVKLLRAIPEMKFFFDNELIVPLLWNRKNAQACLLFPKGRAIWDAKNPVVILTHGLWSQLPQRLLAVHYGKLMEANLNFLLDDSLQNDSKVPIWNNFDNEIWPKKLLHLMEQYIVQLNSVPLTYPFYLMEFLVALTALPSKAFLILSAAYGHSSVQSLRMGSFQDIISRLKKTKIDNRLPVNFHFLKHYFSELNVNTNEVEMQNNLVLQMGLHGHADADSRLSMLSESVNTAMFEHTPALIKAMSLIGSKETLDSRLALIKLSQYDPDVFSAGHAGLLLELQKNSQFDRAGWRKAFECIWKNHIPGAIASEIYRKLATAAMYCAHWSFARMVLKKGMQVYGRNTTDLVHLAWCDARTGNLKNSHIHIEKLIQEDPSNNLANEVLQRILIRLSSWDDRWRISYKKNEKYISLEPLDSSHAEALFLQYRDPQIAVMTGLPMLSSIDKVRSWIEEQNTEKGRINFAIMHIDLGFVGYINLSISEHAAYFCFWTGVDFQGNGFATIASRLAFDIAKKNGITLLLTSAYADNARSIRALLKLGFEKISVRALPPEQDRIFYFLTPDKSANFANMVDEILGYYSRENLPLQFYDT